MYALHLPKLFVMMICIVVLCQGVIGDAPIEPNLAPPVNELDVPAEPKLAPPVDEGELNTSRCIMMGKPGRSCPVGPVRKRGARCAFNRRCSIRCNGVFSCLTREFLVVNHHKDLPASGAPTEMDEMVVVVVKENAFGRNSPPQVL
ncbi:uncharacterized protein PSANT_02149 [Moesziomyces antarcticus]|uniref:Uncharacterized protein n=1 Tax=Pseudozyma antarctica TaxID=84753 RepID=A0A5C3FJE4_PSEA2|nr:uncharacterized protein PSANT_02149 [Moesziomyces antarcticus]